MGEILLAFQREPEGGYRQGVLPGSAQRVYKELVFHKEKLVSGLWRIADADNSS